MYLLFLTVLLQKLWLTHFKRMSSFHFPENIRKPLIFWCRQEKLKLTLVWDALSDRLCKMSFPRSIVLKVFWEFYKNTSKPLLLTFFSFFPLFSPFFYFLPYSSFSSGFICVFFNKNNWGLASCGQNLL